MKTFFKQNWLFILCFFTVWILLTAIRVAMHFSCESISYYVLSIYPDSNVVYLIPLLKIAALIAVLIIGKKIVVKKNIKKALTITLAAVAILAIHVETIVATANMVIERPYLQSICNKTTLNDETYAISSTHLTRSEYEFIRTKSMIAQYPTLPLSASDITVEMTGNVGRQAGLIRFRYTTEDAFKPENGWQIQSKNQNDKTIVLIRVIR